MKPLPLQHEGRVAQTSLCDVCELTGGRVAWRRLAAATKVDGHFALAPLGERAARSAG